MNTTATNQKIRVLLNSLKNGILDPRPEFQRKLIWNTKDKQEFIKTVLMQYPFPEIYIASGTVDPDTGIAKELLVDGQQRLTTLYQYFIGSKDLILGDITPYQELSKEDKIKFLEYEVVIRDLGLKTTEEIKEVFRRINSTKYGLTAMEIHNARYDGQFKKFGEELSTHQFFENHKVFRINEVRRMSDIVFVLNLTITCMTTYFNRDDEIENFLQKYNDEFPLFDEMLGRFNAVFSFIDSLNLDVKSRAWKKAELYTLIIETYNAIFKSDLQLDAKTTASSLRDFYELVNNAASMERAASQVEEYYKATLQATNDRSNRIRRGNIIAALLKAPNLFFKELL